MTIMIVLLHMIVLWGGGEIFVSSQATSIPDIFSAGESGGSIKFGVPWPKQEDSSNPITALTYSIDGMQQVKISLDGAETSADGSDPEIRKKRAAKRLFKNFLRTSRERSLQRSSSRENTVTCPADMNIAVGFSLQFSPLEDATTRECIVANNKACDKGATSCSTSNCAVTSNYEGITKWDAQSMRDDMLDTTLQSLVLAQTDTDTLTLGEVDTLYENVKFASNRVSHVLKSIPGKYIGAMYLRGDYAKGAGKTSFTPKQDGRMYLGLTTPNAVNKAPTNWKADVQEGESIPKIILDAGDGTTQQMEIYFRDYTKGQEFSVYLPDNGPVAMFLRHAKGHITHAGYDREGKNGQEEYDVTYVDDVTSSSSSRSEIYKLVDDIDSTSDWEARMNSITDCQLAYCNAHSDLKTSKCGGSTCTTTSQAESCYTHWTDTGKAEGRTSDPDVCISNYDDTSSSAEGGGETRAARVSWSTGPSDVFTSVPEGLRGAVMISTKGATLVKKSLSATDSWSRAKDICLNNNNMRLCDYSEVCPRGELNVPQGGMRNKKTWLPVGSCTSDCDNRWVAIGNDNPTQRLCRTSEMLTGKQLSFGTSTSSYSSRYEVYCCSSRKDTSSSDSSSSNVHTLSFRVRVRTQLHLAIDSRSYDGATSASQRVPTTGYSRSAYNWKLRSNQGFDWDIYTKDTTLEPGTHEIKLEKPGLVTILLTCPTDGCVREGIDVEWMRVPGNGMCRSTQQPSTDHGPFGIQSGTGHNNVEECQATCASDERCLAFTIKQVLGSCTYFCTSTESPLCDTTNTVTSESTYDGACYDTTDASDTTSICYSKLCDRPAVLETDSVWYQPTFAFGEPPQLLNGGFEQTLSAAESYFPKNPQADTKWLINFQCASSSKLTGWDNVEIQKDPPTPRPTQVETVHELSNGLTLRHMGYTYCRNDNVAESSISNLQMWNDEVFCSDDCEMKVTIEGLEANVGYWVELYTYSSQGSPTGSNTDFTIKTGANQDNEIGAFRTWNKDDMAGTLSSSPSRVSRGYTTKPFRVMSDASGSITVWMITTVGINGRVALNGMKIEPMISQKTATCIGSDCNGWRLVAQEPATGQQGLSFLGVQFTPSQSSGFTSIKIRENQECNAAAEGKTLIGTFSGSDGLEKCAAACAAIGSCRFFLLGFGSNAGKCWHEKTSSPSCDEGWSDGNFNFYQLNVLTVPKIGTFKEWKDTTSKGYLSTLEFGPFLTPRSVGFYSMKSAATKTSAPIKWVVEGRNSDTGWTLLDDTKTRATNGVTTWNSNEKREYALDKDTSPAIWVFGMKMYEEEDTSTTTPTINYEGDSTIWIPQETWSTTASNTNSRVWSNSKDSKYNFYKLGQFTTSNGWLFNIRSSKDKDDKNDVYVHVLLFLFNIVLFFLFLFFFFFCSSSQFKYVPVQTPVQTWHRVLGYKPGIVYLVILT